MHAGTLAVGVLLGIVVGSSLVHGQNYPVRPVRLVVPYPPGGGTDLVARGLAKYLADRWDKSVIVDNRGGAAGMIGAEMVAKAAPDGYTLMLSDSSPFVILPHLYAKMPYDSLTAFAPVTVIARQSTVLAVGNHIPVNNVKALIAYLKANPGTPFGSFGEGSFSHVSMEEFAKLSGTKVVHVPYKGTGPMVTDLIGGRVAMCLATLGALGSFEKAGKLKIIAAATEKRLPFWPDLPTVAEAGVPGFAVSVWFGLLATAGAPTEVLNKIHRDVATILNDKAFAEQILTPQALIPGGDSREAFGALMKSETLRWGKLVKDIGVKL
jgi:tripartite-type tricarboxylate transporter receptor subunit TctC